MHKTERKVQKNKIEQPVSEVIGFIMSRLKFQDSIIF
jgi:hypothetical protein